MILALAQEVQQSRPWLLLDRRLPWPFVFPATRLLIWVFGFTDRVRLTLTSPVRTFEPMRQVNETTETESNRGKT